MSTCLQTNGKFAYIIDGKSDGIFYVPQSDATDICQRDTAIDINLFAKT